jgi:hypothetical protein
MPKKYGIAKKLVIKGIHKVSSITDVLRPKDDEMRHKPYIYTEYIRQH